MIKSSRKLKILHLASFVGNIGDFANHRGFYKKFVKNISAEFTQLEIRRFYKNRDEMSFNESFVELVNKHNLLIIGGGGFFDLKWDYSNTGTTIDFTEQLIKKIKVPVLVNAMGYHEYGEIKKKNVDKFEKFLNIITENQNWFVTVRNDGSFERLQKRYGAFKNKIVKVPDNGFFFEPKKYSQFNLYNKNDVWIGLNITNDLFNKSFNKNLNIKNFNLLISEFIRDILKENVNYKIILFPHTQQDITTIGILINGIEDKYKREKIAVAPFFTEWESIEQIYDLYRICRCIIGMRFHANVCGIGMNIPTIGLAGHEQISALYNELELSNRCIKLDSSSFVNELKEKLNNSLQKENIIKKDYANIRVLLNKKTDSYHKRIKKWIKLF